MGTFPNRKQDRKLKQVENKNNLDRLGSVPNAETKQKLTNKKLKNNKAITLIALVITIIVLLILAGVIINLMLGQKSRYYRRII